MMTIIITAVIIRIKKKNPPEKTSPPPFPSSSTTSTEHTNNHHNGDNHAGNKDDDGNDTSADLDKLLLRPSPFGVESGSLALGEFEPGKDLKEMLAEVGREGGKEGRKGW